MAAEGGVDMTNRKSRVVFCVVLASFFAAASSQESEPDAASKVDEGDAAESTLETCFNYPGYIDLSVMHDQFIYIRTRGSNRYLLTMEHCENLERSYHRGNFKFVPYGRTVCQDDGSYVLYDAGGAERACPILAVRRVENRAEAKSIADHDEPPVEIERAPPSE
jgi:Family of unknown function (DUF6491)